MALVMLTEFFGMIALITTIIGLIPQIYKTYVTKSADDLSMIMLINCFVCSVAWTIYGILVEDTTVILANAFLGLCSIISSIQKIYYDRYNKSKS